LILFEPIEIKMYGLAPEDREFWTDPSMAVPTYSMSDTAKMFFGHAGTWLRMRLHRGFGKVDDQGPIEPARSESGHRKWTLYDIERTARAFLDEDVYDLLGYARTVNVVKAQAVLYGYDLGDYDPMAKPMPFELDPIRDRALSAVLRRLEDEDMCQHPGPLPDRALEHVVARTVWSWRALENHYRGIDG
jgi:hypothetical protein